MKQFAIVICTYNRADLLKSALESICAQPFNISDYEVIVVDNNSTDDTRMVTAAFCRRYPHIRYLFAAQPGSAHARNVGWQAAEATYVAFIDDDCRVSPQWLTQAETIVAAHAPTLMSGPYYACFATPRPRWFKDVYGTYAPGKTAGIFPRPEHFPAGNLFVRRDVLAQVGGFNTQFGIVGEKRGYDEEAELLYRIKQAVANMVAYYDPQLFVYHLVRPEKMRLWWSIRYTFLQGRYRYWSFSQPAMSSPAAWFALCRRTCTLLTKIVAHICLSLVRPDRVRYPYIENYLYERIIPRMLPLGALYEQWLAAVALPSVHQTPRRDVADNEKNF
jgi:glucosyl-dolichyl phosphate glucuronosyltransferase